MKKLRRTMCVASVMLALVLAVGHGALGAPGEPDASEKFHASLRQAAEAYDRGDMVGAAVALKEAPQRVRMSPWDRLRVTFLADPWAWVALGFLGQGLFTARFVVQWLASERRGESVVPLSFWYLSIFGSLMVLAYAVWRVDPVFMLAYGFNSVIYVRNLMLIYRKRQGAATAASR
jgi:lipid-A-disaccharide synthase-like uncharacterized protein